LGQFVSILRPNYRLLKLRRRIPKPASATAKDKAQFFDVRVTEKGFEPERLLAKPGGPVVLRITRTTDSTCAKKIKISKRNIKQDLPLNKPVSIELGRLEKGDIAFACGMDMLTGHVIVE